MASAIGVIDDRCSQVRPSRLLASTQPKTKEIPPKGIMNLNDGTYINFSYGLTRNYIGKRSVEAVHLYPKLLVLHALLLGTMLEMQVQSLTKY